MALETPKEIETLGSGTGKLERGDTDLLPPVQSPAISAFKAIIWLYIYNHLSSLRRYFKLI